MNLINAWVSRNFHNIGVICLQVNIILIISEPGQYKINSAFTKKNVIIMNAYLVVISLFFLMFMIYFYNIRPVCFPGTQREEKQGNQCRKMIIYE